MRSDLPFQVLADLGESVHLLLDLARQWAIGGVFLPAGRRGEDRRHDRYFQADPALQVTAGLTIDSVHDKLTGLANSQAVFVKDFAYSIMHIADNDFLDAFTHTFLIRDPEKVLTSMHSRWPDVTLPEIGFAELHTLFKRVADRTGKAPLVIDSDELLRSAETGMQAYCQAVGIPFLTEALSWEKSSQNPTWNTDEHGFHDALKNSTGLQAQKRDYPPLESSDDMLRLYQASKPHYDALFAQRLVIEADHGQAV